MVGRERGNGCLLVQQGETACQGCPGLPQSRGRRTSGRQEDVFAEPMPQRLPLFAKGRPEGRRFSGWTENAARVYSSEKKRKDYL